MLLDQETFFLAIIDAFLTVGALCLLILLVLLVETCFRAFKEWKTRHIAMRRWRTLQTIDEEWRV